MSNANTFRTLVERVLTHEGPAPMLPVVVIEVGE